MNYWTPGTTLVRIDDIDPRLASWDRADHPDQVALQAYLDEVEGRVAPVIEGEEGLLAIHIHVGLPEGRDLLMHHDVENYLTPLVRRLGKKRFRYARAGKSLEGRSFIEIGRAVPGELVEDSDEWSSFTTTCTGSVDKKAWKERLRQALIDAGVEQVGSGPVQMVLALRCSPRRSWINLLKPLGDSLGPILGEPGRPFAPADDRIVDLAASVALDEGIGWGVEIGMWWGISRS